MDDIISRITDYLANGGLFNPEYMEHEKVRRLLMDCRDELIVSSTLTGVMLQGVGQRAAESMAERVLSGMTVGQWVRSAERLPPIRHRAGQSSDDVFVALQYPDGEHLLSIGYYSHSDQIWRIRTVRHGWQPSHWMPLPAPPEMSK
jgi:hypothetical protein